jgi:hypothetical protein
MMAFLRKSDPIRSAENALASLRKRHDELGLLLTAATTKAEHAAMNRRRLLIEADLADTAALDRSEQACGAADDRKRALEDALRTIAEQIANTEAQLTAERDRIERERSAADLLAKADRIGEAAQALGAAMNGIAKSYAGLVEAIRAGGFVGEYESAETVGAAVLIAGVERIIPGATARTRLTGWTSEEVTAAAERMQSGPLRARAEQVRAGEASAPVASQSVNDEPTITIPEAMVVLKHPITYRSADSSIVLIREGGCSIPAPVAAAAMDQGIGFAPGTPAARAALHEIELGKGGRAVDTGVDLAEWIEAERARLQQRAA